MKKVIFVLAVALCALVLAQFSAFAGPVSPAQDWVWSFTKASDYDEKVLATQAGPTDQTFTFFASPTTYAIYLYGTLYPNQALDSTNIDFAGEGFNLEGLGAGPNGYYQSYQPSIVQPDQMDALFFTYDDPNNPTPNPIPAGGAREFWVFTSYNLDENAVPGEYRVFDGDLNYYDLSEPVGADGFRPLHSMRATNAASWTATPEPISSVLFLLGAGVLGTRIYRRKKVQSSR